jgi:hypothetical protein
MPRLLTLALRSPPYEYRRYRLDLVEVVLFALWGPPHDLNPPFYGILLTVIIALWGPPGHDGRHAMDLEIVDGKTW